MLRLTFLTLWYSLSLLNVTFTLSRPFLAVHPLIFRTIEMELFQAFDHSTKRGMKNHGNLTNVRLERKSDNYQKDQTCGIPSPQLSDLNESNASRPFPISSLTSSRSSTSCWVTIHAYCGKLVPSSAEYEVGQCLQIISPRLAMSSLTLAAACEFCVWLRKAIRSCSLAESVNCNLS